MTAQQIRELIAGLSSERANVRFASAKALCHLSESDPARVYPYFDEILGLIRQPNHILHWNGLRILAGLAKVDGARRIEQILPEYLAPVAGPAMIGAAEAIAGGARIAAAKPHLAAEIVRNILRVESASYATPECRNVAIGHALKAFHHLTPLLEDTGPLKEFAARHADNSRQATRNKAIKLLDRLEHPSVRKAVVVAH